MKIEQACPRLGLLLLGLVAMFGVACGGGGSSMTTGAITVSVSPMAAAIGTGQSTKFTVTTNDTSGVTWSASAGTIDSSGNYVAPAGTQAATVTVTVTSKQDSTKSATATVNVVPPGTLTSTPNGQVALYTVSAAAAGNVSAEFGLDTTYGLTTWTQPVPQGGGAVSLFVAGMKPNATYHIRGLVNFADGSTFQDADLTFSSVGLPAAVLPNVSTTTFAGMTPQSGVELLDMILGPVGVAPVAVTDLEGNILWSYNPGFAPNIIPHPIKLLSNGHFLINFAQQTGATSVMQEVDLGGNVISQFTAADLNSGLATFCSTSPLCPAGGLTVLGTHHDFISMDNGHLIVLASEQRVISGTTVTGDVIIDLDQNRKPVWLWDEFDHLDTNRQPYLFPDWTHSNALLYSKDDHNLIVSIRHQNWLVKVDYNDGAGTGDILWKLGYQGDFTLLNSDGSTDNHPEDWFFAQHGPSFVSSNTTGAFSLILFDNGDDRGYAIAPGTTCGTDPTCYSTVPMFDIDENAKTAKFTFHPNAYDYSFFGGNAAVLKNGNVEYCESAGGPGTAGDIYEVTQSATSEKVWKLSLANQDAYRGQRIPSLYPGVQW